MTKPAEHITRAARQFAGGSTCYYAVNTGRQTIDNFHRGLYKAMRLANIWGWTFHKSDAKTIYIKPS